MRSRARRWRLELPLRASTGPDSKNATGSGEHVPRGEVGDAEKDQRSPKTKAEQEQPGAGRPLGEVEKTLQTSTPLRWYRVRSGIDTTGRYLPGSSFQGTGYRSMIPRFTPMATACVRSLAPSLARIFLRWLFTVSSVRKSRAAISLLALPFATNRSTSASLGVSASSVACSAISAAISGDTLFWPA